MKKTIFIGLACVVCMFVLLSPVPVQAQTQNPETNQRILKLLEQVSSLQEQLQALQKKEAAEIKRRDQALLTNKSNPIAVFTTNRGVIEIELFADTMPITTNNFITLAEANFYDQTLFHRVIKDFMIQGGDPTTKTTDTDRYGTGGPGYTIPDEHVTGKYLTNVRGTISMANAGPNSGGSQFFINLVDNQFLDFDKKPLSSKHPVFGRVIRGMKVVDAIGNVRTNQVDLPIKNVTIQFITIK